MRLSPFALLGILALVACSGGSSTSLDFERGSAPSSATMITGGELPFSQSDNKDIIRTYALFGCNCSFDDVVAHYLSYLAGQGYQRFDEGVEPRARFTNSPPSRLVELSILDPRFAPAALALRNIDIPAQKQASGFQTAYVITLTRLPYNELKTTPTPPGR